MFIYTEPNPYENMMNIKTKMMMNIISINNYRLTLPSGETLLDSVNIQIHEEEKVALIGANRTTD